MIELIVALTDIPLVLQCGIFAFLLRQDGQNKALTFWTVAIFISAAISAFAGFVTHGFFSKQYETLGYQTTRYITLIMIGVTSYALYAIIANCYYKGIARKLIHWLAGVLLVLYLLYISFVSLGFTVAMVFYSIPLLWLLIHIIVHYAKQRDKYLLYGIIGFLLTILAALVRKSGIVIHPSYINYNVLYHIVQFIAFFYIYAYMKGLIIKLK